MSARMARLATAPTDHEREQARAAALALRAAIADPATMGDPQSMRAAGSRALDKLAPGRGQATPLIERLLIEAAEP